MLSFIARINTSASLYSPRPQRKAYFRQGQAAGRKFYYHSAKAVDRGLQRGIPVQQIVTDSVLTITLMFMNLTQAELGTLLTVLGQDKDYPFALKIGGGKPVGMGTIVVKIASIDCFEKNSDRFLSYEGTTQFQLTINSLQSFIDTAIQEAKQK